MKEYFKLIRKALSEHRKKGKRVYYEAHHIIPQSFNKKSSIVLLTPEEHYLAHKYLAEYWKNHSVYGKKMLWAFHRLTYDKGRKLTKEEYGEIRRILQPLWTSPKSEKHKNKISLALKGNVNNSSRVYKGMKSDITEQGRRKLAEARKKEQIGKVGLEAKAAKGPYTVILESGQKYTAGSLPELSKLTKIPYSTLQHRLKNNPEVFKKGFLVRKGGI